MEEELRGEWETLLNEIGRSNLQEVRHPWRVMPGNVDRGGIEGCVEISLDDVVQLLFDLGGGWYQCVEVTLSGTPLVGEVLVDVFDGECCGGAIGDV
eukprot:1772631-Amphidinium_carterae.1